jgi:L-seryl-tRNA(Ser) seleniumtransferase
MQEIQAKLRRIPSIDRLLALAAVRPELGALPTSLVTAALRQTVDELRAAIKRGEMVELCPEEILRHACSLINKQSEPSLKKVINATGIILHTNLGRAPLSKRAQARLSMITQGYSSLEYDIANGERGSRYSHVADRICSLTGAEAAIVVNNNAAAVLLVLSGLAKDREVIVSRGQLVEIGGSFRIPDVLSQSGARLIEVGTTNKTHLRDYAKAIGPDTALILKVHTSNYRIIGFAAQPEMAALVELAHNSGLPLIEDLGSGTLLPLSFHGVREPSVQESIAAGADIVTFSGDKLFGGAQAGVIAGKKQYLDQLKLHPLLRAIRIDKLSLAALEGTLLDYSLGNPLEDIPVQQMINVSQTDLEKKAASLANQLGQLTAVERAEVVPLFSQVGGGALPGVDLESMGVSVSTSLKVTEVERRLRIRKTPIVVRLQGDRIILDMRCLSESDLTEIIAAFSKLEEQKIL